MRHISHFCSSHYKDEVNFKPLRVLIYYSCDGEVMQDLSNSYFNSSLRVIQIKAMKFPLYFTEESSYFSLGNPGQEKYKAVSVVCMHTAAYNMEDRINTI